MKTIFCYNHCSTCRKALNWLSDHDIDVTVRDIATDHPDEKELRLFQKQSGLPVRKLFNTSGKLYREKNLKEALDHMSEDEMFALLSTDGMLVKRPILTDGEQVLVGFREDAWNESLLSKGKR
ncbi:MAG: arsenate reductase family protein [Solobacterium sp.]|nr:arsenate reductase family protein [Solobacterium sp.]